MADQYVETDRSNETQVDVALVLDQLVDLVEHAKSMPLSASVIVSGDEALHLLELARTSLPVELSDARRVLKDQVGVVDRAHREAEQLLDEARAQAAHMVERTEVVRQARYKAEQIVAEAETDARGRRHDADDYVDRKLAAFEIVLDRTMRTVTSGRERLAVPSVAQEDPSPDAEGESESGFFDQDRS